MSAFVIDPETMDAVVDAIWKRQDNSPALIAIALALSKTSNFRAKDTRQNIGEALYDMNWEAVRYRYHDADDCFGPRDPYNHQEREHTALEHAAAISCLRYQCSEGKVPQTPLYKALDALKEEIANEIVDGLTSASRRAARSAINVQYLTPPTEITASDIIRQIPGWQTATGKLWR